MKYYLIAGEASGDLHASHLMQALRQEDPKAQFRCFGGDLMAAQGATLVRHYRELAYMGFIPVLLHARTILRGLEQCKRDIELWHPDALILVDYPGFNLKVARHIHQHTDIPTFYYIAPKIWAWKEHRIRAIRRDVTRLYSILPFEVDFFEGKHHYPIDYVGNPTVDEVHAFLSSSPLDREAFIKQNHLDGRPIIALLAGSRRQEIRANLMRMLAATEPYTSDYQLVLAAAPGIEDAFYERWIAERNVTVLRDQTYNILQHATAALVTSGTATLETALLGVPQVVCYYMKTGILARWGQRWLLHVPYISLVNLIANHEVVPELIGDAMNATNLRRHLSRILPGGDGREAMLQGYDEMSQKLGAPGAPQRAARLMIERMPKG